MNDVQQQAGWVLVDKPVGMSSHQAVQAVRRALGLRGKRAAKTGHAGTLDPFASGALLVLVGQATRLMQHVVGHDKTYDVTIRLGSRSTTDDCTGDFSVGEMNPVEISDEAICAAVETVAARATQRPPSVSALHIDGKRAYKRVRAGEVVAIPERAVTWHSVSVRRVHRTDSLVEVDAAVHCGSGAYIRSLARDIGDCLGCGGYAQTLRRTSIGSLALADTHLSPDEVTWDDLRPMLSLVPQFPVAVVTNESSLNDVLHGRSISGSLADGGVATHEYPAIIAVVDGSNNLVSLATYSNGMIAPNTVLQPRSNAASMVQSEVSQ